MDDKNYYERLPDNYHQKVKIDIKSDKKLVIWLSVAYLLFLVPFASMYFIFFRRNMSAVLTVSLWKPLIFLGSFIVMTALHTLIHGMFFKLFGSNSKIKYGISGLFAYAANSDGYYFKSAYYLIGLMPAILVNSGLVIALCVLSGAAFNIVYILLAFHVSGCVRDIYVIYIMSRLPHHTVVNDTGLVMTFYTRKLTRKGTKK
jgi:hypothetical protein